MMFKPSGNPKVLELTKSIKERSYNLSCLRPIKIQELNEKGKPRRFCAWCAVEEIFHGSQKYCSTVCSNSATAWAYPQKEDGLRFLLLKQEWKCAHCQYDYLPLMKQVTARDREMIGPSFEWDSLSWYYFKRLKEHCPKGKKPEVDHILAISRGGPSLGMENHQILCTQCHLAKTKIDLSGKRLK